MSAVNSPILSSTDKSTANLQLELPRRCGTYWWFWQVMVQASRIEANGNLGEKDRGAARGRMDKYGRAIGVHLVECEQCRRWLESCR